MITERAHERRSLSSYVRTSLLGGFVVSLICLMAFALIAYNVLNNQSLIHVDSVFMHQLRQIYTPWTTRFFRLITLFGYQLLIVLGAAIGMIFLWERQWLRLFLWLIALAGGAFLNLFLKRLLIYPRSIFADSQMMMLYYGFPSGHAIMALSAYGLLVYFLALTPLSPRLRVFFAAGLILLILLVGFSRLYLGAHYLSDVLAGFAVGGFWLSFCITVINAGLKLRKR